MNIKNKYLHIGIWFLSSILFLYILFLDSLTQLDHFFLSNFALIPMVSIFLYFKKWKSGIYIFLTCTVLKYIILFSLVFSSQTTHYSLNSHITTSISNGLLFFLIVYLIIQLEKNNESLKRATFIDTLTNTNNKRFLELYVDYFKPNNVDKEITIMLIDIDDFKKVNAYYGKEYSDSILRDVADVIRKNTRNSDLLIRGEEDSFTVLLTEMNEVDAYQIASRIQNSMEEKTYHHKGKKIPITLSIGLKEYDHRNDLHEFLANADSALEKAKSNGKNQIVSYHADNT